MNREAAYQGWAKYLAKPYCNCDFVTVQKRKYNKEEI